MGEFLDKAHLNVVLVELPIPITWHWGRLRTHPSPPAQQDAKTC